MAITRICILMAASFMMSACGNTADTTAQPGPQTPPASAQNQPADTNPDMKDTMTSQPSTGNSANYARDGNIAIQEEFQDAEIKGTAEAYEMFIARHPDHELSKLAKIRIAEIKAKKNK